MSKFWLSFAITEAISLAEGFIASSKMGDPLKAAIVQFVESGKGVLAALHVA